MHTSSVCIFVNPFIFKSGTFLGVEALEQEPNPSCHLADGLDIERAAAHR